MKEIRYCYTFALVMILTFVMMTSVWIGQIPKTASVFSVGLLFGLCFSPRVLIRSLFRLAKPILAAKLMSTPTTPTPATTPTPTTPTGTPAPLKEPPTWTWRPANAQYLITGMQVGLKILMGQLTGQLICHSDGSMEGIPIKGLTISEGLVT